MATERLSIPQSTHFYDGARLRMNKSRPHWPTLRGAYINDETLVGLRKLAGIIGIRGQYRTNLNKYAGSPGDPVEDAFFGETRIIMRTEARKLYPLYLLWWVGNFHNGSVFHCGWQAPHFQAYDTSLLERAMIKHFHRVVMVMYNRNVQDPDVHKFLMNAALLGIITYAQ